jgi:hypothetical protein
MIKKQLRIHDGSGTVCMMYRLKTTTTSGEYTWFTAHTGYFYTTSCSSREDTLWMFGLLKGSHLSSLRWSTNFCIAEICDHSCRVYYAELRTVLEICQILYYILGSDCGEPIDTHVKMLLVHGLGQGSQLSCEVALARSRHMDVAIWLTATDHAADWQAVTSQW